MGGFEGKQPGTRTASGAASLVHPVQGKRILVEQVYSAAVQHKGTGHAPRDVTHAAVQHKDGSTSPTIHETAAVGASGSGGPLPFADRIQRSFGRHDVSAKQPGTIGPVRYVIFAKPIAHAGPH